MEYKNLKYSLSLALERVAKIFSKKIAYIGSPKSTNCGDRFMYWAIKKEFAKHQVFVTPLKDAKLEDRLNLLGLGSQSYFDAAILGGGTLINDHKWKQAVEYVITKKIPLYSLGTGVGSFGYGNREDQDLKEWESLLSQFKKITLRGPLSKEKIAQINEGIICDVIGDPAILYSTATKSQDSMIVSQEKIVAVNVLPIPSTLSSQIIKPLSLLLEKLRADGYSLKFFAMSPADIIFTRENFGHLATDVFLPSNVDELLNFLTSAKFSICCRLHAGIFSCCAGIPFLQVTYRQKCQDFLDSVGMGEYGLDYNFDVDFALSSIERLINNFNVISTMKDCTLQRKLQLQEYIKFISNSI